MSTMSFLRNITIKKPRQAEKLARALEQAEAAAELKHEVKMSRPVREVRGDEVKNFLKKVKW